MNECSTLANEYHIHAIDLALSSAIPPSPDQAQGFADKLAQATRAERGGAGAAGNEPGAVEEPAAERASSQ